MEKGNVLVIGNAGVGKSTLINAFFGENIAKAASGTEGITKEMKIYPNPNPITEEEKRILEKYESFPFRIIDSVGFEPSWWKRHKAINDVKKWSKACAKGGKTDNQINVIWFCVDGTRRRLFAEDIKNMKKAVSMWKSVPIIAVITKSYAEPDREDNKDLVRKAFGDDKMMLQAVIPVVAETYWLNQDSSAPPFGIEELTQKTNELMPEGLRAADNDLKQYTLDGKRFLAQAVVTTITAGCAGIGAFPIPKVADAALLTPMEIAEVNAIARVYGIRNDEGNREFFKSIVETGAVATTAKNMVSWLKAIPGLNLAAGIINSVVAGIIAATLGEVSIYAFEQVYLGNKDFSDIDWVKQLTESKFAISFVEDFKKAVTELNDESSKKEILKAINKILVAIKG